MRVGVYQDNPLRTFGGAAEGEPEGKTTVSTYVTGGTLIDPKIIRMANKRNLTLVVTWAPDGGVDKPVQPKFRLTKITTGKYDISLRALGNQLKALKKPAIFRPMPEPNTPWHAWSGLVNGNKPAQYITAFRRVRTAIKATGKAKVQVAVGAVRPQRARSRRRTRSRRTSRARSSST